MLVRRILCRRWDLTVIRLYKQRYSSQVELTSSRYPGVTRGNFSVLKDKDIQFFESIVSSTNVLQSDLDGYNTDWLKTVRGMLWLVPLFL